MISGVGYEALASKITRPHFSEKEKDDAVLASLTHQTLKELSVAAVGHRLSFSMPSASCALTRRRKVRLQSCRSSTRVWGEERWPSPSRSS